MHIYSYLTKSQLSIIKQRGCHCGFHDFNIDSTSAIASVALSCVANDPTTWSSTFVLTATRNNGTAYFDVLYVASSKQMLFLYVCKSPCWKVVW